jgi:hypothetical protein
MGQGGFSKLARHLALIPSERRNENRAWLQLGSFGVEAK